MPAQWEREAWAEYLEICREADEDKYEAVEAWAWDQLRALLRELESGEDRGVALRLNGATTTEPGGEPPRR